METRVVGGWECDWRHSCLRHMVGGVRVPSGSLQQWDVVAWTIREFMRSDRVRSITYWTYQTTRTSVTTIVSDNRVPSPN